MLYQLTHPLVLLGFVLAVLSGVLLHNLAQAGAAQLLGDATPRQQGFLSLNLRRHFSPFGLIPVFLVNGAWGWGEPVRMRERYWVRRARLSLALAAGPVTYLALCAAALAGLHAALDAGFGNASTILAAAAETYAGLCVVSMFPVPPLDLGRIILTVAPPSHGWQQARHQLEERNFGVIIALALLLLPQLLPGLPSVVGELAGPLERHLFAAVS